MLPLAFVAVFTTLAASPLVHADEPLDSVTTDTPSPRHVPPIETELHWYGWQTLAVDGGSLGTVFVGSSAQIAPIMVAGGLGLGLGGPIIHAAHGRWGAALGSLALRALLPLAGAYAAAGNATCTNQEDAGFCSLNAAGTGFEVGAVIAIALDAALLSWESVPREHVESAAIVPNVAVGHGMTTFGLSGSF